MILHLQYDQNRFKAATAEAMLVACERIFQEMAARPDVSVQRLRETLGEVEKQFRNTGFQQAEETAIEKLRARKRSGTKPKARAASTPEPVETYD
jgi:hypothetical protein